MKSALAIVMFLLLVLTVNDCGAEVRNPGNATRSGRAPANVPAGDHPLIKAYVIELKYLSPEQAVEMLQGEGSRFKAFIPKEITGIDAVPKSQKLLIQTADAQAAIRLTQLISLIDQPDRLVLQAMLIILSPPGPDEVIREKLPVADGKTPLAPETVQTWVQSLIDNYCGSVVLFSDEMVANNQPISPEPPLPFRPDANIWISDITPDQFNSNLLLGQPSGQKITAELMVYYFRAIRTYGQKVSMIVDQTTLVTIDLPTAAEVDHVPVRYILALTPKVIPPVIPEPGLLPTVGGAAYPGTGTYPPGNVPVGTPGMIPPVSNR